MKTPPPDRRQAVPAPPPSWMTAALVAAAVVSAVAVDGFQSHRGGPSFIFPSRTEIIEAEPPRTPMDVDIREALAASGFPGESPSPLPPEEGPEEIAVQVSADIFEASEDILKTALTLRGIAIETRETVGSEAFSGIRWHVGREDGKHFRILFLWPLEKKPEEKPAPELRAPPPKHGKVALVVDDMGNDMKVLDVLISLGERLTVAILPYSPHARQTARIANDNGIEVMLHLPLESLYAHESLEPPQGLIRSDMSRRTIRRTMEENLDRIPHIRGVNNHMGSRGTADIHLMHLVLAPIKERNLFFLDSLTSNRSIAGTTARQMGIPTATRHVFIDDGNDALSAKDRLDELFRQARTNGFAVGICHPYPQTLEALKEKFRGLEARGLKSVYVSEIVR